MKGSGAAGQLQPLASGTLVGGSFHHLGDAVAILGLGSSGSKLWEPHAAPGTLSKIVTSLCRSVLVPGVRLVTTPPARGPQALDETLDTVSGLCLQTRTFVIYQRWQVDKGFLGDNGGRGGLASLGV